MDIILELQCENIKIESYGDLELLYEAFFPGKSLDIPRIEYFFTKRRGKMLGILGKFLSLSV